MLCVFAINEKFNGSRGADAFISFTRDIIDIPLQHKVLHKVGLKMRSMSSTHSQIQPRPLPDITPTPFNTQPRPSLLKPLPFINTDPPTLRLFHLLLHLAVKMSERDCSVNDCKNDNAHFDSRFYKNGVFIRMALAEICWQALACHLFRVHLKYWWEIWLHFVHLEYSSICMIRHCFCSLIHNHRRRLMCAISTLSSNISIDTRPC